MKVIIMAGGRGTRIQSVARDIPKPMIRINGTPVLEHEIRNLVRQGYRDLIITVSHLGSVITDYFGDGSRFGASIEYFNEEQPLGNAGALFKLRNQLGDEPFFLLNGDSIFDIDFNRMHSFHMKHNGLVTLFTHPNSHPYDSGLIVADRDMSVKEWLTKEDDRPEFYKNRVNAGIHIIDPKVLDMPDISVKDVRAVNQASGKATTVDLDRQILKPLAGTGQMFCYDSPEYVKDMGTPERLQVVVADFEKGIVSAKNLSNKQRAIFLDRDGTINKYVGFLRHIGEFELLPEVSAAIQKINMSGYLAVIVTNQPVIARGEVTFRELEAIHNKMETLLGLNGAYVDAVYFCPHHPHKGYDGEIPALKVACDCRKPEPGMLLAAAESYNIDLSKSWMVGDGENDIKAGIAAGCQTILLSDGEADYGQDYTAGNLLDAISLILLA